MIKSRSSFGLSVRRRDESRGLSTFQVTAIAVLWLSIVLLVGAMSFAEEQASTPRAVKKAEAPFWLPPDAPPVAGEPFMRAAASYALPSTRDIDLDDPSAVLAYVLSQLPERVDVIPTENYLWNIRGILGTNIGTNIRDSYRLTNIRDEY